LVAEAFLPNPDNLPDVNHKNIGNHPSSAKNIIDNRVENLEWVTESENTIHAYEHGFMVKPKGSESFNVKLNEQQVLEIREMYKGKGMSYRQLAKKYKVSFATIRDIITRKTWTHI
jgi:hypothetical protein